MKRKSVLLLITLAICLVTGCGKQEKGQDVETGEVTATERESVQEDVQESAQEDEEIEEDIVKEVKELTLLKTKGKNIYDQSGEGELVQLKGVNVGGWLFQEFWMTPTEAAGGIWDEQDIYNYLTETYGEEKMWEAITVYQDNYFTEADFDNCQNMGMNCLRLPFWYLNIVDMEGNIRENWYERIDWFIENAKKRGMYVIIDCHGAPGSQNGSDHSGIDGGANKMLASEFFFGQNAPANQELYYTIWELIAERYKDEPAVAAYDLLNEPYCSYRYDTPYPDEALHGVLWDVYDKVYDKIRAIDDKHIIIMEATWDPVDLPNPDDYGWTNIMYEYHNYLYDDYNNDRGQQISNMQNKIDLINKANYDVPSYMGEFNYMNNYEAWAEGLDLLNREGIHWTIWTYKTVIGYENWGLYNQTIHKINLVNSDIEKIIEHYGKMSESVQNEKLANVVSEYLKKEPVEDK